MARHGRAQPQAPLFLRNLTVHAQSQLVSTGTPVLRFVQAAGAQVNRTTNLGIAPLRFQQAAGQQVNRTVAVGESVLRFVALAPTNIVGAQTVTTSLAPIRFLALAPTTSGGAQPIVQVTGPPVERYKRMETVHIPNAEWGPAPVFTGRGFQRAKTEPKYVTARAKAILAGPWPVARGWATVAPDESLVKGEAVASVGVWPEARARADLELVVVTGHAIVVLGDYPVATGSGVVRKNAEHELLVLVGLLDEERWL